MYLDLRINNNVSCTEFNLKNPEREGYIAYRFGAINMTQSVPNTCEISSNKFVMFRTSCRQRNTIRLPCRSMRTSVKASCGSETVKKLISSNLRCDQKLCQFFS